MTFRIEEKINIKKQNLFKFYDWLNFNSAKKIYPDRKISSLYFDNQNLNMYHDSIEGLIPRKKIRVRSYNNQSLTNEDLNIEKKITSAEGRFKESTPIKNVDEKLKFGILDQNYGICKPIIKVCYNRAYYSVLNYRVTLDTNIIYFLQESFHKSLRKKNDENIVVEIKSQNTFSVNDIQDQFLFQRIRFSKYCRAIELVFFDKLVSI